MIFAPFDAADISALRNVKMFFFVSKNDSVRTRIIGIYDNPVLIRDIACSITLAHQTIVFFLFVALIVM
jgi:hypothetical protein